MKVKIGNQWYDSDEVPILVKFSSGEYNQVVDVRNNVGNKSEYTYSLIPAEKAGWTLQQMREWMHDERRWPR